MKIEQTHTASAAPARRFLDSEKYLCAPCPLPAAGVAAPRVAALRQRKRGLDAQLLTDPIDASTEAAARTALCTLMILGANWVFSIESGHRHFFSTRLQDRMIFGSLADLGPSSNDS
jgi:hypothetical protein